MNALLTFLNQLTDRLVLIGTWKAATWAIRFYERNGFVVVGEDEKNRLLQTYRTVPPRQREESVVRADNRWRASRDEHAAARVSAAAT